MGGLAAADLCDVAGRDGDGEVGDRSRGIAGFLDRRDRLFRHGRVGIVKSIGRESPRRGILAELLNVMLDVRHFLGVVLGAPKAQRGGDAEDQQGHHQPPVIQSEQRHEIIVRTRSKGVRLPIAGSLRDPGRIARDSAGTSRVA